MDGLPYFIFDFMNRCGGGDTSGKVRYVGGIVGIGLFFDNDCLVHFLQMPLDIHAHVQDADYFDSAWYQAEYENV